MASPDPFPPFPDCSRPQKVPRPGLILYRPEPSPAVCRGDSTPDFGRSLVHRVVVKSGFGKPEARTTKAVAAMAQETAKRNGGANGWTPVAEPPAGVPEQEFVRLGPLLEELTEIQRHVDRIRAYNATSEEAGAMEFVVKRIRARIWEGLDLIEEATPQVLAAQLGVSDQTIRNWCDEGHIQYRRRGRAYLVDVRSTREYAAAR